MPSSSVFSSVLVQLSDTHIVAPGQKLMGWVDTPDLLAQAVASVAQLRPEPMAVLVTGDLVDKGGAAEYAHLKQLLAPLACPLLLMPGNHDSVPALREAFSGLPCLLPVVERPELSAFVLFTHDLGGLRVVALDTTVVGQPHGTLCSHRLAWLNEVLAASPGTPTIVAMHHPPFASGIAHMDRMGLLEGVDGLEAVLRCHPQVQRVVCGHLHRSTVRRFGGTVAMSVPSTAHQIALNLHGQGEPTFRMEPPGWAVHALQGGEVVSHLAVSADCGPQHLFG